MNALAGYLRRYDSNLTAEQAAHLRAREAERLGLSLTDWVKLRGMPLDLALVREAHRVVSMRAKVRRADREGAWELIASRPGHLRSQPQSVRIGEHVEPAWDHGTLRHRLAGLVNATRDTARASPASAAASLVHGFVRAQPFNGDNERVALVVASLVLCAAGLPALHATELAADRAFAAALIEPDAATLTELLADATWSAALDRVEALAHPGSYTLAAEHAALVAARRARSIDDAELAAWTDAVRDALAPQLAGSIAATNERRTLHAAFEGRLRAATAAAYRARAISAQQPIHELRWALSASLDAVLVVAHAGRGVAGAASAHFAFEVPGVPAPHPAPAVLLIPDEPATERSRRLAAWAPRAIAQARRHSPLRL